LVATVDWARDPESGLADALDALVTSSADRLRIVWCAGVGVTATPQHVLDEELRVLADFVDRIRSLDLAVRHRLTLFYSSSAGGVYAGSSDSPPFTEGSAIGPLAPYGHAKIEAERRVGELTSSQVRVVVGRISNLYGPGQNLNKSQGLISQLCRGQVTAQPVGIYVSLDTLRDYVYVDDCAEMILGVLDRADGLEPGADAVVKILAAQRSVSIAGLIGELRRIVRRRPSLVVASSSGARQQARDLRFRSTVWTELDDRARTPLAVGIAATRDDIGRRFRAPGGI
jgi:UDP-glucose 4-epimerase